MSREFGSYESGYFHYQMERGAEDCKSGRDPLTRLWGEFLAEFQPVAYAIASSEACDSGPDFTICETVKRLDTLKRRLDDIAKFVQPYARCMEEAVRTMRREAKGD